MWSVTARVILRFRAVFIWLIVVDFFRVSAIKKSGIILHNGSHCQVIQKPS